MKVRLEFRHSKAPWSGCAGRWSPAFRLFRNSARLRRGLQWPLYASRARSGTILVFAMVVLAIAAVGMAGWVYLMGAMVEYTNAAKLGMDRRLALENSKALATQYLREKILPGTTTDGISGDVAGDGNDLGSLTISAAGTKPLESTGQPSGENPFSPAGYTVYVDSGTASYFRGYSVQVSGTLSAGQDDQGDEILIPWSFEARSRGPSFAYDLVSVPAGSLPANMNVVGSAARQDASGSTTASGLLNVASPADVYTSTVFSGSGATEIFPAQQFPVPPDTDASKSADYICDGAGNVTIYLKRDSSEKNFFIGTGLTTLTFDNDANTPVPTDAAVSDWSPVRVICSTSLLSTVTIPNGSQRRLYLAIDNHGAGVTINPGSSPLRLSGVFKDTAVAFAVSGNLSVTGGFRSNSAMSVTGGTMTLSREANPRTQLERMADRRVWVEAYRND